MNNRVSDAEIVPAHRNSPYKSKSKFKSRFIHRDMSSCSSNKLSVPLLVIFVSLLFLVIWQIRSLPTSSTTSLKRQWDQILTNYTCPTLNASREEEENEREVKIKSMADKLRDSVTFLPLKDLRYTSAPMDGHTWFMSSLYDTQEEGQVQYQQYPSPPTGGRLLCFRGRDTRDGAWNSYALAWPEALPRNATLMGGITFISNNHYDYHNIWHGLSAMMAFVAWHVKSGCAAPPERWLLYHWGELRTSMAPWVNTLLEATFGAPVRIETFDGPGVSDDAPVCFEKAAVMRHNEGGMSSEKRMQVYDLMRCRSRMHCKIDDGGRDEATKVGMTVLMRDGARSFRNATAVVGIFEKECRRVEGCRLNVAYPQNLTFCQQVELMSKSDVLISAHGAQLSNMIFMDRNSSVMEMFPKGWKEFAGVGQYVHHWLASWAGMKHEGAWRDTVADPCPYPEDDRRCMSVFKNARIGHNETVFSEWARNVIKGVVERKAHRDATSLHPVAGLCGCSRRR